MPKLTIRRSCLSSIACLLAVGACTTELPAPADYTRAVGEQLRFQFVSWGNPPYDSLPTISAPVVRFVSMTVAGITPEGPMQVFLLEAQSRGRATVTFHMSGTSGVVKTYIVDVQ